MTENLAEATIKEQLIMLKDLTRRLGVLHEAQVMQLKMAPWGFWPTVKSFDVYPDTIKKDMLFELKLDGKKPAEFDQQCEKVNQWVKWLLGDEWIVRVKLRGKQVFRAGPTVRVE